MTMSPDMGCSPAALGQMWWEVVGSRRHGILVSWSAGAAGMEPVISPGAVLVSIALGEPVPQDVVRRGSLVPQRRKQDGLQDRNASHHLGQICQVS